MKISPQKIIGFASLLLILSTSAAHARGRIADGGNVATCSVAAAFGTVPTNGAVTVDIGVYDSGVFDPVRGGNCDPTTLQGFSVNIGGSLYSQFFLNENGVISFGAPIGDAPSTPIGNLAVPAFAPFFADGFLPAADSLVFGYTSTNDGFANNSLWLTWDEFLPEGNPAAEPNVFQLGIIDLGGGDFDLVFNYVSIAWDPAGGAQAGLTDGAGNFLALAGALVPGAYLGFDDTSGGSSNCQSATPATALACNAINDGGGIGAQDPSTGTLSNGYYLFSFRDGAFVNPAPVPLPAALPLFLLGVGALGARRKLRR
jgi:hypothetical protein